MCPPTAHTGAHPAPERPSEDSIWTATERLRTATRIAGLHLRLGGPRPTAQGERVRLGEIDRPTAQALTELLTGSQHRPLIWPETEAFEETAERLRNAANAAEIRLLVGPVQYTPAGPWLPLDDADHATVARLADLIRDGLACLLKTAQDLRDALEACGIDAHHVTADGGAVELGEIAIGDGDILLSRLTHAPAITATDPDDCVAAQILADRLTIAVRAVTRGGLLDATYTPYCHRCRTAPALLLGRLRPQHAQALTDRLRERAA